MIRTSFVFAVSMLVSLAIAACGDDDEETPTTAGSTKCAEVAAPEPKQVKLKPPDLSPPPVGSRAVLETSCGTIEIELDTQRAPKTTASFAYLIEKGVYDDTPFHRIAVAPPIIQGGDPEGSGLGGPGYSVDEPPPTSLAYTEGLVAMAKTEVEPPGRSGSQFFIVTGPDAGLPPDYALVGEVASGSDVVDAIADLGSATDGPPSEPVVIERATLEEG